MCWSFPCATELLNNINSNTIQEIWAVTIVSLLLLFSVTGEAALWASPTCAHYGTLNIKIRGKKLKMCRFISGKWFWSCICAQLVEARKRPSKAVHQLEKSVINMIWLLLPVFDGSNIMIGPGGLLLVSSYAYLRSRFHFYGWGCKKVNN